MRRNVASAIIVKCYIKNTFKVRNRETSAIRQFDLFICTCAISSKFFELPQLTVFPFRFILAGPQDVIGSFAEFITTETTGGCVCDHGFEVFRSKDLIQKSADTMHIFVSDLNEYGTGISEEVASYNQTITQITQVGVDAIPPCIPEGTNHLRFTGDVLAVFLIGRSC